MSDSIRFDTDGQRQVAGGISQAVEAIRTILDTLDGQAAALAGQWSGDAQEAYASAQRDWSRQLGVLVSLASDAAGALERASSTYDATERRNAQRWAL
ncbi:WXG100 family type VII secretion target [Microbacterium sp. SORGH_AS_0862]|uniref:WXG100 family type VII secretion target n=1 Tax=Microbacterium sp. SORGH_AS_0862 TaxID=3041789 RepID=UPI00278EE22B|nr:WXG100 family type VII secretion target [Microbacterium sp. SORGH_AS_0862]MDQ1204771.1 WXG100 family type VII secretion target [Microbacterium sp. SORGH_AS_0862]